MDTPVVVLKDVKADDGGTAAAGGADEPVAVDFRMLSNPLLDPYGGTSVFTTTMTMRDASQNKVLREVYEDNRPLTPQTTRDVCLWARELGFPDVFIGMMVAERVDGDTLQHIDDACLDELGLTDPSDCAQFKAAVDRFTKPPYTKPAGVHVVANIWEDGRHSQTAILD